MAYKLALPQALTCIHNIFHVSMLKKYISDPSHVIEYAPLYQKEDLTYKESSI